MKKLKAISTFFLLSLIFLFSSTKVHACEVDDKLSVSIEEQNNLISLGSIDNLNIMMDESSLESLSEDEKNKILDIVIESLINQNDSKPFEFHNKNIGLMSTRIERVVHSNHTCYPTGPYLMDVHYKTVYVYYEGSGLLHSKVDFFICGHMGALCYYLYSVTTYYSY